MGCASSAPTSEPQSLKRDPEPNVSTTPHDFYTKYKLGNKIARGGFGQVHIATDKRLEEKGEVAVKVLNLLDSNGVRKPKKCRAACQEVGVCTRVGMHPNCVYMHEGVFDDHLCYMVMELCPGSLSSLILSMSEVNEGSLAPTFSQMLQGIAHMHSLRLVHRDIKSQNFLVGTDNKVKLADCGLSAYIPEGEEEVHGFAGTVSHMSPEMVREARCGIKTDIWSFGVLAHVYLCGSFPYSPLEHGQDKMKAAIANGEQVKVEKRWLTSQVASFLTDALNRDPESRPTASQMLSSKFLTRDNRGKDLLDLRIVVRAADEKGMFASHNADVTSISDHLISAIKRGKLSSVTRAMSLEQIDEFLNANEQGKEHLVEEFWLTGGTKQTQVEDGIATVTTHCSSFAESEKSMSATSA